MTTQDGFARDDVAAVDECRRRYERVRGELAKVIVGQEELIEQVLIAILAQGHALLEGVPGVAKTLLLRSLAEATQLTFRRIRFTPDLLPSDVRGAEVLREDPVSGEREYRFLPGPLFANLIVADEINLTPPKTQAAVLEAMQEREVGVGGSLHRLPDPFFVLATQSPLEQESMHPLRQAQLDQFLLHVKVDYPSSAEEWEIARRATAGDHGRVAPVMSAEDLLALRQLVGRIPLRDQVLGYAWALVRASRPASKEAPEFVERWVEWGAGPRATLTLVSCAKARAILHGRYDPTVEDVQALAKPALRHRIAGNYAALANNLTNDRLVDMLLEAVPPRHTYEKPPDESAGDR